MCIQALKAGKHVLLEKPISIDLASSLPVLAEAAAHPELKVMVALSRRFDASNRDAYARRADLGEPYLVKSATNDMRDPSGFFVKFSATSGGIALDMGIHDCDGPSSLSSCCARLDPDADDHSSLALALAAARWCARPNSASERVIR